MDSELGVNGAHVLIVPYPAQGHVSPMEQFAKLLTPKGIKVTIAYNIYFCKTVQITPITSVDVATFSDGYDDGRSKSAVSWKEYLETFERVGTLQMTELVAKANASSQPFTAIVYDSFIPWVRHVARSFNLVAAVFLTQSLAVNFIYYQIHRGDLPSPLTGEAISVPGFPKFCVGDAPSFVTPLGFGTYPAIERLLVGQFEGSEDLDWVITNIFYELQPELSDWLGQRWRLASIGPTVPSLYRDTVVQDSKGYGTRLSASDKTTCMSWLDSKPAGSVVYVSLGTLVEVGKEQMEELAWGLRQSGLCFLWAVRASEAQKLPDNYSEEVSGRGLMVGWCEQVDVLGHASVGCFVTHCGFNSVMEALCLGVPMVAIPQWTDQPTNAACVEEVWKVGIRPKVDETRVVRREAVAESVKVLIEGERGRELKENATKWKELAMKAVSEGGSSEQSICNFVADLVTRLP